MRLCSGEAGWSTLVASEVEGARHGRISWRTGHCAIVGILTLVDGVSEGCFYDSTFALAVEMFGGS